jgi:hypothetical protein
VPSADKTFRPFRADDNARTRTRDVALGWSPTATAGAPGKRPKDGTSANPTAGAPANRKFKLKSLGAESADGSQPRATPWVMSRSIFVRSEGARGPSAHSGRNMTCADIPGALPRASHPWRLQRRKTSPCCWFGYSVLTSRSI